ncbi:phage head morphogenesis protein [Rahnella sp. SAP-1]|uniref:Phage head morphogenesis protein n=2 Tax=Rouxiella aceris TaxID=2703884 RepID=A0A848MFC7_9GAMM|nr:phage head morphogenesis protein [Rouxiella aceris]
MDRLGQYSDIIDDWADTVATNMVSSVNKHDENTWKARSQAISKELHNVIDNTPVGHIMRSIVAEQVKYIKSLPIEAADRVYDIQNQAIELVANGGRSTELAEEIMRSGEVAESRAKLIARTEVGRASVALTQARALSVGSDGYIWRTADDGDVRHSHDLMNGKFVRWDSPPTLDGMTGHAGCLPNCRCYPEVVIPHSNIFAMQSQRMIDGVRIVTAKGKAVRVAA